MTAIWPTCGLKCPQARFEVIEIDTNDGGLFRFYVDKDDPEAFIVARVVHDSNDSLILSILTPRGIWDGFLYLKSIAVADADADETYLNSLLKLSRLKGQTEPRELYTQLGSFGAMLRFSETEQKVVGVECYESGGIDITGIVMNHDDGFVEILQLDEYGREDGYTFIRREAVTRMSILSEKLTDIELLYKNP